MYIQRETERMDRDTFLTLKNSFQNFKANKQVRLGMTLVAILPLNYH